MKPERRSGSRLIKAVKAKDDGRRIIYYDRPTDTSPETDDDG